MTKAASGGLPPRAATHASVVYSWAPGMGLNPEPGAPAGRATALCSARDGRQLRVSAVAQRARQSSNLPPCGASSLAGAIGHEAPDAVDDLLRLVRLAQQRPGFAQISRRLGRSRRAARQDHVDPFAVLPGPARQ